MIISEWCSRVDAHAGSSGGVKALLRNALRLLRAIAEHDLSE